MKPKTLRYLFELLATVNFFACYIYSLMNVGERMDSVWLGWLFTASVLNCYAFQMIVADNPEVPFFR